MRKLSFQVAAFAVIAPVPVVEPITMAPQPLVIFARSAVPKAKVPAPPAMPIDVATAFGAIVSVPVPVRALLIAMSPFVSKVRLLADMACVPAIVITPEPVRNVKGSCHV